MIQEIRFPSMRERDTFLQQVNDKYSKIYPYPAATHVHYLGGGGPFDFGSSNSKYARVDLNNVSNVTAVGQLIRLLNGTICE